MRALIVSLILGLGMAVPASAKAVDPVFPRGLPAAISADTCAAHRCVWVARLREDGTGRSYILTTYRDGFLVRYISHRRAERLFEAYCQRPNVDCRYGE